MALRIWLATAPDRDQLATRYAAYMDELLPKTAPNQPDSYFESYWGEPGVRFPYLFGDAEPQGFAFVRRPRDPDLDIEMAEFCVGPDQRRSGIGTAVLPLLFNAHPGRWEISILQSNKPGLAFWPVALQAAGVTNLRYLEEDHTRTYRFNAGSQLL